MNALAVRIGVLSGDDHGGSELTALGNAWDLRIGERCAVVNVPANAHLGSGPFAPG